MSHSSIIVIDGVLIGTTVATSGGYRFTAVDPQTRELDGQFWASFDDLRYVTGQLFRTGQQRNAAALGAPLHGIVVGRHDAPYTNRADSWMRGIYPQRCVQGEGIARANDAGRKMIFFFGAT